ncbi:MAG: CvpA family protein [Bacilli bacterium]|nr:CvpA family protein [Bacilli bacterium]MDD4298299.1 CvpA family protein [Bacilli bacterium]MDD4644165.1 CvpA family protein [Bacilli bacterium]
MLLVDVLILLALGVGAVTGFARGFFRQTVQSIGGILVVVLAFIFRRSCAAFLLKIFPAFKFGGIFRGISSLNILVYEIIAFVLLLVIFGIAVRIILSVAVFIEKIFNSTVILALPSKVLGAIMGVVEAYFIVFIVLFVLTLPVFNFKWVNQSKYKDTILTGTPILSGLAQTTVNSFGSIYALKDDLLNEADRLKLDQKILKILIDNRIISQEKADELFEEGKLDAR